MKKIYLFILIVVVLILTGIFLLPKDDTTNHYIIEQSYGFVYNHNKKAEFDIYTKLKKSFIEDTSSNEYYLRIDKTKTKLNNVDVIKSKTGNYHVFTVSFDLPEFRKNVKSDDVILSIVGNKILNIKIGHLSIIYENVEPVYSSIYASYSYIEGSLLLTGINIILGNEYDTISYVSVNDFAYSNFNNIIYGLNLDNEINIKEVVPNYSYNDVNYFNINIKSNKIFIPITYYELLPVKHGYISLTLNDKNYVINDFDFVFNNFDIEEYAQYMKEYNYD